MSDKTAQDAPVAQDVANEPTRAVTIDLAYTADKSRVVPITHPDADSIFALAGSRIPESLARKYLPGDFATE